MANRWKVFVRMGVDGIFGRWGVVDGKRHVGAVGEAVVINFFGYSDIEEC